MNSETSIVLVGIIVAILIAIMVAKSAAKVKADEERKRHLYSKYGRTQMAENIVERIVWTGETSAQLHDSLGAPSDVDQKVLKTKKKEVWKYNQTGVNRYSLKITLDDDVVVGWDQK